MTAHDPAPLALSLLEIRDATFSRYGKPLLDGINLNLNAGESVALIGPNGAGKSTLLKLLAGELPLHDTCYLFNGKPYRHWTLRQLAERRAVLPQQLHIQFPMRVAEVVALGLPSRQRGNLKHPLVQQMLAWFDAEPLLQRHFPTLSGGEQQRVQLARVIAQIIESPSPATLLLDECTSALDPAHQHHVLQHLKMLTHSGHGMLWSVHDLNLAARYADRILMMKAGKIVADGTPHAVLTPARLAEVFGIDVRVIDDEGIPHILQRGKQSAHTVQAALPQLPAKTVCA